jgi:hypothetical protein
MVSSGREGDMPYRCTHEDAPCCGCAQEQRMTDYYADDNDPYGDDFYDYFDAQ